MPTRPSRSASSSHHGPASTRHAPTNATERPIVGQVAGATAMRDLAMDVQRDATRLARLSGLTAADLKTEIDRGFHAGRGVGR